MGLRALLAVILIPWADSWHHGIHASFAQFEQKGIYGHIYRVLDILICASMSAHIWLKKRVFNHELILISTNNKICMSRVCVFLCRDSHTSTHKSFWKISPFTWSTISSKCYLAASQNNNWQDFLHCIEMLTNRQPAANNTYKGRKKSVHIWCCEQKKKSYSCPYVKTEEYCAKVLRHLLCFKNIFYVNGGKVQVFSETCIYT